MMMNAICGGLLGDRQTYMLPTGEGRSPSNLSLPAVMAGLLEMLSDNVCDDCGRTFLYDEVNVTGDQYQCDDCLRAEARAERDREKD
jgi:hypothetical protein